MMDIDLPAFLPQILDNARELISAEGGSIFLKQGDRLMLQAATGLEAGLASRLRESYSLTGGAQGGLTGWVAQRRKSMRIYDMADFSKFGNSYDQVEGPSIENLIAVPITSGEKIVGVLRCTNKRNPKKGEVGFQTVT